MIKNNDEYLFSTKNWCIDKSVSTSENIKVVTDNNGTKILIIFLYGTIIDKITMLKDIEIPINVEIESKIGVYSGLIDSNVKRFAKINKIKLVKSLIFPSDVYTIRIEAKTAINKSSVLEQYKKRPKTEIEMEILNLIAENFSMPVTKLVYRCNLNYKYCVNLIIDMVKDEILEAIEHGSGMRYQITPKGTEYMKNLRNIASVHHVRDV